jgi:hypothetical protein
MFTYFEVSILGSDAVYQEVSDDGGIRFTDANGVTVATPEEPIVFQTKTGAQPFWGEIPVTVSPRTISKLEYMNRFTDTELATIFTAAKSNVALEIWLEKFKLAEFINLDDPATAAGLAALTYVGILAAGRMEGILNA